jgi:cutinase
MGTPSAFAHACPDVEVVFARGTSEPTGVGEVGNAFVDSLRSAAPSRTVAVYPVDYPATTDFPTAVDGVIDAANHVLARADGCPDTKMVLGGYSQGAAVIAYLTADRVPANYVLPAGLSGPMPSDVAEHVAAVALFGKPSEKLLNMFGAPPIEIGRLYTAKTIDECVPKDPICGSGGLLDRSSHKEYLANGMVGEAAGFAASRL